MIFDLQLRTESWHSRSINQRNPTQPFKERPGRGNCYLALTFGTLLSSQGADAQELEPLGFCPSRLFQRYTLLCSSPTPGGRTGGPTWSPSSVSLGAWRTVHDFQGCTHGGPSRFPDTSARRCRQAPGTPGRPGLRPPREAGTARSPGGRRAAPSWGRSAPRCVGRSRP